MSYDKPDEIPERQIDDSAIWHTTGQAIRVLDNELRSLCLRMEIYKYFKNEYCGERLNKCGCPHWFQVKIESLHKRIYEPHCYIMVCKRKRVYEIRFDGMVDNDFWINTERDRSQGKDYIHSYGLIQAAQDIRIIHQAAELHDYKSEKFRDYYASLFQQKKKSLS